MLEDFTKVQPDRADLEPIDLLYFSGFTPDEQRRGEKRLAHQVKRKAKRNALARLLVDDPAWPADTSPLHEIVLLAIERYLIVGGILIIQSYCDGINPRTNAGYVAAWEAILRQCGVTLLEGYCFAAAPAVTLWIGIKIKDAGPAHGAHHLAELRRTLAGRLPLQCFHGRAQVDDKRIIRFYPSNRVLRRALAIKRRLVG